MTQTITKSVEALYFNKTNPIEVANSLKGVEYPVDKQGLLKCARGNDACPEVIKVIKNLPEREYDNPITISREISNIDLYGVV